ncbi:hypothetical protein ACJ41O_013082 [Fusarium nematophilum]
MRKHLSSLPEVTINGVRVTGAGGLTFNDTSSSWTYTGLTTDVDITAEGISLPVSVKIDGKAAGLFFIMSGGKGSGKACLAWRTGSGKATAQLPFVGEQVFDLAPRGGYFFDMDVEYTCSGRRMTIVSGASGDIMAGGSPEWGPFAYNAASAWDDGGRFDLFG